MSANDVAIIGMQVRVPGARDLGSFWDNIKNGVESTEEISDTELERNGVPRHLIDNPNYVKSGAFLAGIDRFDAGFFGLTPQEASVMDPQHRVFLEAAYHALENSGIDPYSYSGSVGVFAGSGYNAYFPNHVLQNEELVSEMGFFLLRHTGNDKDFLATRVSYCLNLRGPSVNVQTACSTSLVAVHQACQSVLDGECDVALAGAITLELPQRVGYLYTPNEILSDDGHCRPFDDSSTGTIFGSGVGVVVLKEVEDAQRDGDKIWGVIKGSAVNNDGSVKAGYLAPSVDGQAAVIREAIEVSGLAPSQIGLVEAHGTGTRLGDPVELAALNLAYKDSDLPSNSIALGSVKGNIGHLDTAAGVVGLIKLVLAIENSTLPRSINYSKPNSDLRIEETPFYVNSQTLRWTTEFKVGAVSSLGVGGTNAHVIVSEHRQKTTSMSWEGPFPIVLSAASQESLDATIDRIVDESKVQDGELGGLSQTLLRRRVHWPKNVITSIDKADKLESKLDSAIFPETLRDVNQLDRPKVVFGFSGQGSQFAGMSRGLYETYSVYRSSFDDCCDAAKPYLDFDLKQMVFEGQSHDKDISDISVSQVVLFAVEYSTAAVWNSLGITSDFVIGHSSGQIGAATHAGLFDLSGGIKLIAARGRLMRQTELGGMLSVALSVAEVERLPLANLEVAAINADNAVVLTGEANEIDTLASFLENEEIPFKEIRTSHAGHSRLLDPILSHFGDVFEEIETRPNSIPIISNVSGQLLSEEEMNSREYWMRHLRSPVNFHDSVQTLASEGDFIFIEVGPGSGLCQLAQLTTGNSRVVFLQSARGPTQEVEDPDVLASSLAAAVFAGAKWDSGALGPVLNLPTYPFQPERHWIERVDSKDVIQEIHLAKLGWKDSEQLNSLPDSINGARQKNLLIAGYEIEGLSKDRWDHINLPGLKSVADFSLRAKVSELELALADHGGIDHLLYAPSNHQAPMASFYESLSVAQAIAGAGITCSVTTLTGVGQSITVGPMLALGPELAIPSRVVEVEQVNPQAVNEALTCGDPVSRLSGAITQNRDYVSVGLVHDSLKDLGTIVITGGSSGIGLVTAEYLSDYCSHIAIIGRQHLPDKEEWPGLIEGKVDSPEIAKLSRLVRLNRKTSLSYHAVAVEDAESVDARFREISSKYGEISGLIHAAGVIDDGPLLNKTVAGVDSVLSSKVAGTKNLINCLPRSAFLIGYSSLSALIGVPGQADYISANSYLNAAIARRASEASGRSSSICWGPWKEAGIAHRLAKDEATIDSWHPLITRAMIYPGASRT
ncbi:MAG: SDR family oxidoreductase [Pseudomonadales bacterium]|nr:SDR family oxidoreductase [Pseudomonadales bacterium]